MENNDLISRSALLELAHNHVGGTVDCNDIARFPAVDAEVVRHGRWTEDGVCIDCGFDALYWANTSIQVRSHYCPNCGAKMDGDVNAAD